MKEMKELSKDELLNLLYNEFNVSTQEQCECAACGKTKFADYYYICDTCNRVENLIWRQPIDRKGTWNR
jgi:hypothetical protein